MKCKVFLFALVLLLVVIGTVYGEEEMDRKILYDMFTLEESKVVDLFHQSCLDQLPAEQLMEFINQYKEVLGELKQVTKGEQNDYNLLFEKGKVTAQISLNKDNKVLGFFLSYWTLNTDTVDKILSELKNMEGSISVCLIKNNQEEIIAFNENKAMAVASSFKLYILQELYKKVGSDSWDRVIRLNDECKSLPTGILQDWPTGTPLTLKTLANLMISISDNTATDHLIQYIGKDELGENVSKKNKPFLKTNEMVRLKYGVSPEIQQNYINGDIRYKREILNKIKNIDINTLQVVNSPLLIEEVEWFFTTKELCRIIYNLQYAEEIYINPGLASKKDWYLAGFKGGSEPGVLQYTHLLKKTEDSDIYTLSITANNTKDNIDANNIQDPYVQKINEITVRLIGLIKDGKI